jgi:hypothetical protein
MYPLTEDGRGEGDAKGWVHNMNFCESGEIAYFV